MNCEKTKTLAIVLFLLQITEEVGIKQEVFGGLSSFGRASDLHSEGEEFESPSLQFRTHILHECAGFK